MSETEYKRYDSAADFEIAGARLTKDAEVKEGANGKMVRLTFVVTSKNEADSDLWVEAQIADNQAELAAFMKKGDTLHKINGFPVLQKYGENNEKFAFKLRRTRMEVPIALFVQLKERGFTPGAKNAKPAAKPPAKKQRPVVDLDD